MSQTEGQPASLNVISSSGFECRQSIIALMLVLAPMALAVIVMAIGLAIWAMWLIVYGAPAELPPPPGMRLCGLLSYAVASWLVVALAWVWTARQGLRSEVFKFRRLRLPAIAASLIGFGVVAVGVPIVTHWLTRAVHGFIESEGIPDLERI